MPSAAPVEGAPPVRLVEPYRRPDEAPAGACASCGATEDLVDQDGYTAFCQTCSTPPSALEFPEYYCDLGGGD